MGKLENLATDRGWEATKKGPNVVFVNLENPCQTRTVPAGRSLSAAMGLPPTSKARLTKSTVTKRGTVRTQS